MAHIVVLGGGYGGTEAVKTLYKHSKHQITLIDQNSFHFLQANLHEFLATTIPTNEVVQPLADFAARFGKRVRFVEARARAIDQTAKNIVLAHGEVVEFDALIVASGATTFFPDKIKDIREYARDIKGFRGAIRIRQRFEMLLYAHRASSVVIGGAGLSGVEIACEMAYAAAQRRKYDEKISIFLVEQKQSVLPEMDKFLIRKAEDALKQLGITVLCGMSISEAQIDHITLENGTELRCDLFVFTGGILASNIGSKGKIEVRNTLQIAESDEIFAIGDVAKLHGKNGALLPATSQTAKMSGKAAARNAIALLEGKPLELLNARNKGILVALGGNNAIGLLFEKYKVQGAIAAFLKRWILRRHRNSII